MTLEVASKRVTFFLATVVLALSLADLATLFFKYYLGHNHLFGLAPLFDFFGESNLPTWFSSSTLLLCSLLLATIALGKKRERDRFSAHWTALSVIFLYLSIDEAAEIHEKIGMLLQRIVGDKWLLHPTWVVFGAVFVLIFALSYMRFVIHLPPGIRRLFLLAGAIYVTGALLLEAFEGYYLMRWGFDFKFEVFVFFEELLEMSGIVLFIHGLFSYMSIHRDELRLRFLH